MTVGISLVIVMMAHVIVMMAPVILGIALLIVGIVLLIVGIVLLVWEIGHDKNLLYYHRHYFDESFSMNNTSYLELKCFVCK